MKRNFKLLVLPFLVACTSAHKEIANEPSPQARDVAQTVANRPAAKAANKNIVRQLVGKWVVDQTKCSVQGEPGQRAYISVSGKGQDRQVYLNPYHIAGGEVKTGYGRQFTNLAIRFGKGEKKSYNGFGGMERWNTTVSANQISSQTAIRQKRGNEAERDYFQTQTTLKVQNGKLQITKAGDQPWNCELSRPAESEAYYLNLKKFSDPKLQEIYKLASGFTAETDQMALEVGKAKYVKADVSLSPDEIQELLSLQVTNHIFEIVQEEITTPEKARSSTKEALDKLIAYGRERVKEDGAAVAVEYAPLAQIKEKLRDLINRQTHKAYYINWGGGGDSMGDGVLVIDEQNKEVLYIGNGDYI